MTASLISRSLRLAGAAGQEQADADLPRLAVLAGPVGDGRGAVGRVLAEGPFGDDVLQSPRPDLDAVLVAGCRNAPRPACSSRVAPVSAPSGSSFRRAARCSCSQSSTSDSWETPMVGRRPEWPVRAERFERRSRVGGRLPRSPRDLDVISSAIRFCRSDCARHRDHVGHVRNQCRAQPRNQSSGTARPTSAAMRFCTSTWPSSGP